MRPARALTLLLFTVLLVPLTGMVGTASAAEATKISIAGKPTVGVYHDEIGPKNTPDVVRHRGQLTTTTGVPVVGSVELQGKLPGGAWQTITDEVTDPEGRYEFFGYIVGNATYRVVYAGDATYAPSQSGEAKLKAMRDFNAQLVEKPRVAILKGSINPDWNNKSVQWQRKTCKTCAWKTIDRKKSGDNGAWRFKGAYPPLNKKWFYRATLDGTKRFVKSRSAMLITTTTPARQSVARTVVR